MSKVDDFSQGMRQWYTDTKSSARQEKRACLPGEGLVSSYKIRWKALGIKGEKDTAIANALLKAYQKKGDTTLDASVLRRFTPSQIKEFVRLAKEGGRNDVVQLLDKTVTASFQRSHSVEKRRGLLEIKRDEEHLQQRAALCKEFIEKSGEWKKAWVAPPLPTEIASKLATDEKIKKYEPFAKFLACM